MCPKAVPENLNEVQENKPFDISSLRDKTFVVAVSTGPRDKTALLPTTIRGPFDFLEMLDFVGVTWSKDLNRSRVASVSKLTPPVFLNDDDVDYILENYVDIILSETFFQ
jgi:hypothetical protein